MLQSSPDTKAPDPKTTTKTFGPFELLAIIGRGANATVYKARHTPTGKLAAVKILSRLLGLEPAPLERFRREFTHIRKLQHRHLVRSVAFGEEKGLYYVVFEFVPGHNLEYRLRNQGPLPIEDAVAVFVQIADGLRYLHSNQILHRDIKPSNIFLTPQNIAKLGDFGLLKQLTEDAQITQTHQALGTMEYGAPEQFEDAKRVDRRCDIFSLAASMYTALTGKFPFGNAGQMQTLQRKMMMQFVPLRMLVPSLAPAIDQLVTRCLDPDPRRRPTDCDEFLDVLASFYPDPEPLNQTLTNFTDTKTMFPSAGRLTDADAPAPSIKPSGDMERRAMLRYAVDLSATFVPFHQTTRGRWEGTIFDISSLGVRLRTSHPVAVGAVVHLTLGNRATSELAQVRWVKPGKGETYVVGCAFVRALSRKDLEEIFTTSGADGSVSED